MQSLHGTFRSNIFGFLLVALAPVAIYSAVTTATPSAKSQAAEVQSASGRITSVQGNTFTLETPQAQNNSGNQFLQDDQKVITLMIDQNTAVDGKIEVGADANVTYQQQDGNNIAVSVHIVKQPS